MPLKSVFKTQVKHLSILDEEGNLDEKLAAGVRDVLADEKCVELLKDMMVHRELDEAAFRLQRSGRMGTYPQNKGQEAVAVGVQLALKKGHDQVIPAYRENGALFQHGLPMHYVLLHWMGDERGNAIPAKYAVSPICVEIGAQCLHGAGWAWAFKLQNKKNGTDKVAAIFFGDGATSEGDFHEAMNFASVLKTPALFVCQNNGFAISVPTARQSASETFAQKAIGYGMPTIQVDGNDLFAVYKAATDMVAGARKGKGPGFIEALTYRLGDHTTADDSSRYRTREDLEAARGREPFVRLRKYLSGKNLWSNEIEAAAQDRAKKIVREVVEAATGIEKPETHDIFNHAFADLPADLKKQRDTLTTSVLVQEPQQERLQPRRPQPPQREMASTA